jgi:hypothetical protein
MWCEKEAPCKKTVLTKSSYLHLETELKCNVQVRLGTVMIYDFKCARCVQEMCQVTVKLLFNNGVVLSLQQQ